MNNAHSDELSEFSQYQVKEATIDYSPQVGYTITRHKDGRPFTKPLADFEVTFAIDPAASERRTSAQTSRTAMVISARDSDDSRIFIDGAVGYFDPTQVYDHIFRLYSKYKSYIRATTFESGGPFRVMYNTLIEEQSKRGIFIGLRKVTPLPDKNGKIRNYFQPLLDRNQIYACEPIKQYVVDELRVFPGGNLKDTLDACELTDRYSQRPLTTKELEALEQEGKYRSGITNRAGW